MPFSPRSLENVRRKTLLRQISARAKSMIVEAKQLKKGGKSKLAKVAPGLLHQGGAAVKKITVHPKSKKMLTTLLAKLAQANAAKKAASLAAKHAVQLKKAAAVKR